MKRLLLVDDDNIVMRSYRDRLSAHGFQVNTAPDGSAAIAILRSAKPDLVVLDLMMPNLSGVEVLKFIRAEPRLAPTPVVVLTNFYLSDLGRQAAAIGIEKVLLKAQCSPSVLMSVVDEILASRRVASDDSPLPAVSPTPWSGPSTEPPASTAPTQSETAPADRPAQIQASPPVQSTGPEAQTALVADDHDARAEGRKELLAQGPAICADLRKLFQAFAREPRTGHAQEPQLRDLYRKVHFLTAIAGASECTPIAQMADVFEALLFVLIEQPARIGPSVLRTIASLVDFVELLLQHARESRLSASLSTQVLVVDDDPLSNRLTVSGLRQAQLRARATEDPLVAWQWLQREQFHLVLLDIEMPGLGGFELCQRLRTLPAYKNTPVIYVTSHSDFENRAKSTLSGGDDLIAKPILPIELAAKVVMHLLRSQLPT